MKQRKMVFPVLHIILRPMIFLMMKKSLTAFLDELPAAQNANANFELIASMINVHGPKNWKGEPGYFTKEMLHKYIDDLSLEFSISQTPN